MILISNDCAAGYMYNIMNLPYNSPFIWANVLDDDFLYIMHHYYDINFANYEISFEKTRWDDVMPANTTVTVVTVDNKIKLYFTHHLFTEAYGAGITKFKENRIGSKGIGEMVKKSYVKRIARMYKTNERPIFIWQNWDDIDYKEFAKGSDIGKTVIVQSQSETIISDKVAIYSYKDITPGSRHVLQKKAAEYLLSHCDFFAKH